MIDTLILDLDDTLLVNPMDTFLPPYFKALTAYLASYVPPDRLVPELLRATQAMTHSRDAALTNAQVFAAAFYPALGLSEADMQPVIERFYEDEFPRLKPYTQVVPEARPLLETALARGYGLVVATNPLFPRRAIEHRLEWADVGHIPWLHVTSYETSHYTKPHPEYYAEILAHIGRPAPQCLMVGNDLANDILPAKAVGMSTFWVTGASVLPPAPGPDVGIMAVPSEQVADAQVADYQGTLADLLALIETDALRQSV